MEETPDIEASEIKVIKKPEKESSQTKVHNKGLYFLFVLIRQLNMTISHRYQS